MDIDMVRLLEKEPVKPDQGRKTPPIEVRAKRIICQGEKRWKIMSLAGLKADELPRQYTHLSSSVSLNMNMDNTKKILKTGIGRWFLEEGQIYTETEFKAALARLEVAGELLVKINRRIHKENSDWHGEETFKI